jgi:hypothetical protein
VVVTPRSGIGQVDIVFSAFDVKFVSGWAKTHPNKPLRFGTKQMLNRREVLATTVVSLGACLLGYAGRCFGWYWDNVLVPKPWWKSGLLIHQGNVSRYGQLSVNPDYYVTLIVKADGTWVRVNGKLIPYDEWLKKDVYVRSRAPMTKGQYRIGT